MGMNEIMTMITERVSSERLLIAMDIWKLIWGVVSMSHFIACLWYGISAQSSDRPAWVTESGFHRLRLIDQYMMSMHWALAQFAGGMDEVTPQNLDERAFAVIVFILAFSI